MHLPVLRSALIGCGRQLLLLTMALVHVCQLTSVAADCGTDWCQGLFCVPYGRAFDENGCVLCECFRPCQELTCSAGQSCTAVLVEGCDGVRCQKYTEQCTAAQTTTTPFPCPSVDCAGTICRYGFSRDANGCQTCRCRHLCDSISCPTGQICKVTPDDCQPDDECRDGPMAYCTDGEMSARSTTTAATTPSSSVSSSTTSSTTTTTSSTTSSPTTSTTIIPTTTTTTPSTSTTSTTPSTITTTASTTPSTTTTTTSSTPSTITTTTSTTPSTTTSTPSTTSTTSTTPSTTTTTTSTTPTPSTTTTTSSTPSTTTSTSTTLSTIIPTTTSTTTVTPSTTSTSISPSTTTSTSTVLSTSTTSTPTSSSTISSTTSRLPIATRFGGRTSSELPTLSTTLSTTISSTSTTSSTAAVPTTRSSTRRTTSTTSKPTSSFSATPSTTTIPSSTSTTTTSTTTVPTTSTTSKPTSSSTVSSTTRTTTSSTSTTTTTTTTTTPPLPTTTTATTTTTAPRPITTLPFQTVFPTLPRSTAGPTTPSSGSETTSRCPVVSCFNLVCSHGRTTDSQGCVLCSCVEPCQDTRCPSGQTCKTRGNDSMPYCDAENKLLEGILRIDANYSIIDAKDDFRRNVTEQIGSYLNVSSERIIVKKILEGSIIVVFDIDEQTNASLDEVLAGLERMRSLGIVIIYNEDTYAARLVNYTLDTTTPRESTGAPDHPDSESKSNNYNFLLLVVLVCVLVPLVIVAIVIIIVVAVKKSKGTLAVSNRRQEWSIMQDKIYPELEEGVEKDGYVNLSRSEHRRSSSETFA